MATKQIARIAVVLCGIIVGATITNFIVEGIQLQTGRDELASYAHRVLNGSALLAVETEQTIADVNQADLAFCSDQELAFMRDYVYKSTHVKDIGRVNTSDGKLYCTTGIGRLPVPAPSMIPDISINGMDIGVHRPLLISNRSSGLILRAHGVSVILNPDSFSGLDELPKFYSGYFYDQTNNRVFQSFGHTVPLTDAEVLAGYLVHRSGIFYIPLCSPNSGLCIVAAESQTSMLATSRSLFTGYIVIGGLLGGAAALILILFYDRQRSDELQLRRAIRRGDLTLVYQPVVNLKTHAIVGAEALVRWKNEAGEHIRPDVFVALAEEKGFVGEITKLVLRKSLLELRELLITGDFQLTINITTEDLTNPEFFVFLAHTLRMAYIQPSAIGLELTERSTADQAIVSHAIRELKRAGHTVYIDDFGTGYSSLAYLHRLEADAIKIDRVFTKTVGTEAITASIVPQILNMATEMDLMVVVEGIETSEQAEYFRKVGVGALGQGWYFSRPVPAAQMKILARIGVIKQPVSV